MMSNDKEEWIKIGEVGVDSGQLMICDPCYIDSMWEKSEYKDIRLYQNIQTKKYFLYETGAGKRYVNEYLSDDNVVYFKHYQERLLGGTTPNENIENKLWIECEIQEDSSFSYNGVSHTGKKGFKQIKYPLGHDGLAVNFCSGYGDGTYDVFAKIKNGRNWEIKIVLISEKDENYE